MPQVAKPEKRRITDSDDGSLFDVMPMMELV
jgi:hypothetical protein